MLLQQRFGGHKAGPDHVHITGRRLHELLGIIGVVCQCSAAIHVQGKGGIALASQPFSLVAGKLVVAPPLMNDQNSRALAGEFIIPGQVAGERRTIDLVFHGFGL